MVAQEQEGPKLSRAPAAEAAWLRRRGGELLLLLIIAAALALGALGISYGLPFFANIDEPHIVERASRVAHGNTLNPGWFGHPASTVIYPVAGLYKLHSALAHGIPPWRPDPAAYELLHRETLRFATPDAAPYYLLARLVSLAYFVAGVGLTYALGAQLFDRRTGLLAAGSLACCATLLEYARIARSDTAGMAFTLLALVACARLLHGRAWRDYALAGMAIGLAGATRYLCLAVGVALIAAHVLSGAWRERGSWRRLLAALVAIPLAFLVASPALPFALGTAYRNLVMEARDAGVPLSYPRQVWWYLSQGIPLVIGWPLWLAALGGAALALRRRERGATLLLITTLVFLLVIAVPALYHERWVISIAPLLLLLAAALVWRALDALHARLGQGSTAARIAAAALLLALFAQPAGETLRRTYLSTRPDTRELASRWIEANLPAGSRIAAESYAPLIGGDYAVTTPFHLHGLGPFDRALTARFDYFVATEFNYGRFYEAAEASSASASFYGVPLAFYEQLFMGELVAEFRPGAWTAEGPVVRIYRSPGP